MYQYIQFHAETGRLMGSMSKCELDDQGRPVSPAGTVVIDSAVRPEAATATSYNAEADTFTQPAAPKRQLTKADVIAALSPARWAEMCKFHPTAAGVSSSGTAYSDADVFWAVSVLNAATRPFTLDDPRIAQAVAKLVAGGVFTPEEAAALRAQLS